MDPGYATPQSPLMSPAGGVSDLTICAVSNLRPAPCQATCGGRKPHPFPCLVRGDVRIGFARAVHSFWGCQVSEAEVFRGYGRGQPYTVVGSPEGEPVRMHYGGVHP